MKSKSRIKIVVVLAVIIMLIILVIVPHLIIGDMVNMHVSFETVYSAQDYGLEAKELWLETEDGLNIVTYFVPVENAQGSVIFLSGIHNPSVTAFYGHAKMLADWGYDSYLLEMRAHGESEGDVISLGFKEVLDVDAVVNYIVSSEMKNKPIIVYGLSMGGAVAINSIGSNDNIDGVISLSAYSSFTDNFSDNMLMMNMPKFYVSLQKPFVTLYTSFKYGFDTTRLTPKNMIKNLGDRPALLIHSREDDQVPVENLSRILQNAPSHVNHWIREGNYHMILDGLMFLEPWEDEEYRDFIFSFLSEFTKAE